MRPNRSKEWLLKVKTQKRFFGKCENCGGQTSSYFKSDLKRFCSHKCSLDFAGWARGNAPRNGHRFKAGPKHDLWNGGRILIGGYVLVHSPKHPNRNNKGYVPEHRLVMEKHIGRYLKRTECVHHENEIRDDNRIENLRLFKNKAEHQRYHKSVVADKSKTKGGQYANKKHQQ